MRVPRIAALFVTAVWVAPAFTQPGGAGQLEQALAEYNAATERIRKRLTDGFDRELARLPNLRLPAQQRVRMTLIVEAEKCRFEGCGLIPWSEPMREHTAQYLEATAAAANKLRRAYEPQIDKLLKARQLDGAKTLSAQLDAALAVGVVAEWHHQGKPAKFFSNGKINDPDGNNTWRYDRAAGLLRLWWKDVNVKEGGWSDACRLEADGWSYAGHNQRGPRRGTVGATYFLSDETVKTLMAKDPLPAAEIDNRMVWKGPRKQIAHVGNGAWLEKNEKGETFRFQEVTRTPDFVEVRDAGRGITLRLASGFGVGRTRNEDRWWPWEVGQWEKK